jgi:hypothetical protein
VIRISPVVARLAWGRLSSYFNLVALQARRYTRPAEAGDQIGTSLSSECRLDSLAPWEKAADQG